MTQRATSSKESMPDNHVDCPESAKGNDAVARQTPRKGRGVACLPGKEGLVNQE
jgi:hypothetical protein